MRLLLPLLLILGAAVAIKDGEIVDEYIAKSQQPFLLFERHLASKVLVHGGEASVYYTIQNIGDEDATSVLLLEQWHGEFGNITHGSFQAQWPVIKAGERIFYTTIYSLVDDENLADQLLGFFRVPARLIYKGSDSSHSMQSANTYTDDELGRVISTSTHKAAVRPQPPTSIMNRRTYERAHFANLHGWTIYLTLALVMVIGPSYVHWAKQNRF
ncbi:unnamed protein product, partial [Mesorhabditis spiculigera]